WFIRRRHGHGSKMARFPCRSMEARRTVDRRSATLHFWRGFEARTQGTRGSLVADQQAHEMKITIQTFDFSPAEPPRVGHVYPIRGGRGLRDGHMQILMAITEERQYHGAGACMLVVTKEGKPVGVNYYGLHALEGWCPIAFVDGLED